MEYKVVYVKYIVDLYLDMLHVHFVPPIYPRRREVKFIFFFWPGGVTAVTQDQQQRVLVRLSTQIDIFILKNSGGVLIICGGVLVVGAFWHLFVIIRFVNIGGIFDNLTYMYRQWTKVFARFQFSLCISYKTTIFQKLILKSIYTRFDNLNINENIILCRFTV